MAKTRTKDKDTQPEADGWAADGPAEDPPIVDTKTSAPPFEPPPKPESAVKAKDSTPPPLVASPPSPKAAANIPLEVFGRISGVKPDQFAGFAWYAKREHMGPRPVVEWREAHDRFLARAV